ncbi:MAG: CDP-alcohol phosphatidyltransferase family protein [Rickettsiales bacterium]|nr:MAG: CDP-alcohol phosphatidyltransferase family protein [Rickettsiales bacterium]
MKKLPDCLDNQYDNVLTVIVSNTVDMFYNCGFNPNGITTLSLIFGILAIGLLKYNKYIEAAICYLISYFFDCMDGYMARKYNLTTNFGDYYDHIKDMIVFILLSYVIFIKFKKINSNLKYLPLIILPFLITSLGSSFKNASFDNGLNILSSILFISLTLLLLAMLVAKSSSTFTTNLNNVPSGCLCFNTAGKYPSRISSIIC